ncbi:MAG TPA: sigma 54-interacting transcriptional regulator [Planctomycetaceae bacterium]|nr:sigma 54-interacting transcriptional regulator [Planctomycetaceae bacterium]
MSNKDTSSVSADEIAFLLTWDGAMWRDVVRLRQGQVTTIGRSATNRIVLQDDACSRNHCEVFYSSGDWRVRDLSSRNGTNINGHPVAGDTPIESGDVIGIGECRLAFTTSLESTPFSPPNVAIPGEPVTSATQTAVGTRAEPSILHRTAMPEFLAASAGQRTDPNFASELAKLYRLGLEMGTARTRQQLTDVVLANLARETVASISAILLAGPDASPQPAPADLQVVAYDSRKDLPYRRVSDNLSRVVLSKREAILARDVGDDHQLSFFDSLGEMKALSVICAPIIAPDRVLGLIHLYSTNPDNPLDKHDLEFTLAVSNQLAVALRHLQERDSLQTGLTQARNENRTLRAQLTEEQTLIGETSSIIDLRERLALIAETDASVLIRGESGCGKELIARSIHLQSPRCDGPFVCVNCAALNESLLESELFGHEKGAFTGAVDRKIGRFEQADGGTLFLDEVGEMSPSIQAKFLRVLEGHVFERIGGRKPIQVDVRIVAATNRDLEEAVEDGDFRKDLYFRLQVAEITASPLRERKDDIELLANAFLRKFVQKTGRVIKGFTDDAMQLLRDYNWPGNVRELQNTIERTVILCRNELVRAADIQLSSLGSRGSAPVPDRLPAGGYRELSMADIEQEHILATLEHTGWNKSRASQILGIERSTLDRKLKRYHVPKPTTD